MSEKAIAFVSDEMREAVKQFRGIIVKVDYSKEPFGFEGAPGIERKTPVLGVQIDTPDYDKPQYEWFPPSNVKKTKPACKPPEEYPIIWDTPAKSSPRYAARVRAGWTIQPDLHGIPSRRQMGVLHRGIDEVWCNEGHSDSGRYRRGTHEELCRKPSRNGVRLESVWRPRADHQRTNCGVLAS